MTNRVKKRLLAGAVIAVLAAFVLIMVILLPSPKENKPQLRRVSARPVHAALIQKQLTDDLPVNEIPIQEEESESEPQDAAWTENKAPVPEKEKPMGELSAPEIMAGADIIAHGLGSIDGLSTLNCLEAFQEAYAAGVRVFEVDLRLTRDCQVVLRHDWWSYTWQKGISWANIPTREKFLSEKILDKYTPMSFQDLLLLMERHPDICVVTDTKFSESDVFTIQFDAMLADARELGLTYLFDRIFIQIYSTNMKMALDNIYPFPHYIYTLYQDEDPFTGTVEDFRKRAAYAQEARGVEGITMEYRLWRPAFAAIADEYGINVYVHTVNEADAAKRALQEGIDAVYTDSLCPRDLAPDIEEIIPPDSSFSDYQKMIETAWEMVKKHLLDARKGAVQNEPRLSLFG